MNLSSQPKEIWKTINEVISCNEKIEHIQSVTTNSGIYTDPVDIAELFNDHFTEIGPNLAPELPKSEKVFEECITQAISMFRFKDISTADVEMLFRNIKTNEVTGLDKIPSHLVKEAAPVMAASL